MKKTYEVWAWIIVEAENIGDAGAIAGDALTIGHSGANENWPDDGAGVVSTIIENIKLMPSQ